MASHRSRQQRLQPVYDLVTEAQGHLRDARTGVPTGFVEHDSPDLDWLVSHLVPAHKSPMTGNFCRVYRDNLPVDLVELISCIEADMRGVYMIFAGELEACIEPPEIEPGDSNPIWAHRIVEAANDAHRCYACALAVVKVLVGWNPHEERIVPPAPEGTGMAAGGGP
ncbi:MAG: hypothetical protein HY565_04150 [Candidatus Kerfeldbacteria bacterium]|nr:hypothetical protein [Candidatus Kerfeldbacteria bacterium]